MRCATTRPSTSVGPPAANGITIVIGRGRIALCHRRAAEGEQKAESSKAEVS